MGEGHWEKDTERKDTVIVSRDRQIKCQNVLGLEDKLSFRRELEKMPNLSLLLEKSNHLPHICTATASLPPQNNEPRRQTARSISTL